MFNPPFNIQLRCRLAVTHWSQFMSCISSIIKTVIELDDTNKREVLWELAMHDLQCGDYYISSSSSNDSTNKDNNGSTNSESSSGGNEAV
jgi:hypothetical protein